MSGKPFKPELGKVYENRGGGCFKCIEEPYKDDTPFFHGGFGHSRVCAEMQNIKSGWTFIAKGIMQYADGQIEWDRSVGGYFMPIEESDAHE